MRLKKEKVVLLTGIFLTNSIYLLFLLSYDTHPVSDWGSVWNAARQMADGTFTDGLINGTYMHEIPYQLGLAFVESILIRIFGASFTVLKVFNVLLMNLITLGVYHFSRRKASQATACFAYLATSVFLCWSMTVPQFTNHHLGIVFLYLSLYFFEKKKYGYSAAAGVSLALLNFVRSMGIIVVLTFLCATVYEIVKTKKIKGAILRLVLFYACYMMSLFLLDSMLLRLGYTDVQVSRSSRNIYHKITYGTYDSQIDGTIAEFDYDHEKYNEAYRQEIISQIREHPKEIAVSIANKMCRYLGMFDYGFEMTYDHDQGVWSAYPIKAVYSMQWFQYVLYIAVSLYGFLVYRKRNETDLYQIFYLGNTLVYLFIEAFSAYRFESYFYLLFLVGYGLNEISEKIVFIRKGHKQAILKNL